MLRQLIRAPSPRQRVRARVSSGVMVQLPCQPMVQTQLVASARQSASFGNPTPAPSVKTPAALTLSSARMTTRPWAIS